MLGGAVLLKVLFSQHKSNTIKDVIWFYGEKGAFDHQRQYCWGSLNICGSRNKKGNLARQRGENLEGSNPGNKTHTCCIISDSIYSYFEIWSSICLLKVLTLTVRLAQDIVSADSLFFIHSSSVSLLGFGGSEHTHLANFKFKYFSHCLSDYHKTEIHRHYSSDFKMFKGQKWATACHCGRNQYVYLL